MKKPTKPKKNSSDLTLRNARSYNKRLKTLERQIKAVGQHLSAITMDLVTTFNRLDKLEAKKK